MEISRNEVIRQNPNVKPSIKIIDGNPNVRVLAYVTKDGTFYVGEYYYIFSKEWVAPFCNGYDIPAFRNISDAIKYPMEMVEMCAKRVTTKYIDGIKDSNFKREVIRYMNYYEQHKEVKLDDSEIIDDGLTPKLTMKEKRKYGLDSAKITDEEHKEIVEWLDSKPELTNTNLDPDYLININKIDEKTYCVCGNERDIGNSTDLNVIKYCMHCGDDVK